MAVKKKYFKQQIGNNQWYINNNSGVACLWSEHSPTPEIHYPAKLVIVNKENSKLSIVFQ
jgi:hypothetical protein